jgi:F-type H+-transporting ATPase subunit gamma
MAGLKEIRTRIASVKTTKQVTSAMKMVSAAKLKKAQDAILQIRPYADKMSMILSSLSASLEKSEDSVYTLQREPSKVLIVLISSNRGLCGGFNSNVTKKAAELARTKYSNQFAKGNVSLLAIGKMGERQAKTLKLDVAGNQNALYDNLSFESVSAVASAVMASYAKGEYDCVELVYNQFKNAAIQVVTAEKFLPVEIKKEEKQTTTSFDFIYEPSKEYIIQELIPRSLKIQFYKAMLDSNAAENGARMTAMHQATDNATELLKELTLQYNKARQASITNEILEIVSGAEALKG